MERMKYICRYCGKKTTHEDVCDKCALARARLNEESYKCFLCTHKHECADHTPHRDNGNCLICGKPDSCMPIRGGLCLECFARKWNAEHPVQIRVPTTAELSERNYEV